MRTTSSALVALIGLGACGDSGPALEPGGWQLRIESVSGSDGDVVSFAAVEPDGAAVFFERGEDLRVGVLDAATLVTLTDAANAANVLGRSSQDPPGADFGYARVTVRATAGEAAGESNTFKQYDAEGALRAFFDLARADAEALPLGPPCPDAADPCPQPHPLVVCNGSDWDVCTSSGATSGCDGIPLACDPETGWAP